MGRLGERVAIVTGGAGDIGSAVARALAAEGASVVIADVRDPEGTDLAADLGGPARFVHLDVTSEDDWQRALADTAGQPIPRFGEREEVARMVLFIVIDATFSTGSEFIVDGGILAGAPAVLTPDE